jgi:crossover junction endodeoxyribonuclease RuvC
VDFAGSPRLAAAGVLRPPAGALAGRLLWLFREMGAVLAREHPDRAAVERVFAGENLQSLITLGEARGVLLLALAEAGVPAEEITPAEIKKSVAGSGTAEKEQVRRMVASLLGRRLALDAADAAAVALAHGFVASRGAVLKPVAPAAGVRGRGGTAPWRRRPAG